MRLNDNLQVPIGTSVPLARFLYDTLQAIVAQKNGNIVHGQRTMSSGAEMALQTERSSAAKA